MNTPAPTKSGRRAPFRRSEPPTPQERFQKLVKRLSWFGKLYERLSFPVAVAILFTNNRFDKSYGLTRRKRLAFSWRVYRNTSKIPTGVSYKAHLAMAVKIFEIPRRVPGVIVECGCWKGGTTANLSIICDIVGRDLIAYDSFEGLPEPEEADKVNVGQKGAFRGDLEVVQDHVRAYGVIDRVQFRKGWFRDTLPHHTEPIAAAFVDVDLRSSIHDCLVNLWPHLNSDAYLFFDEYCQVPLCSVFFSERFWRDYLDTTPPGLLGTGTGIGVGQYFLGPRFGPMNSPPIQRPSSIAYTRKDFSGYWDYVPLPEPSGPPSNST